MQTNKKILAVGHDAFRAGAQIVFLHVLRWLREHHGSDVSLALSGGGELVGEYEAVLPTRILPPRTPPTSSSRMIAAARRARHRMEMRDARLRPGSIDLVYANSVAAASLAAELATEAGCPAVCHVHELEMSMRRTISGERFRQVSERFERFIAVSGAVERNLVENHGLAPERITRIHPGIPLVEASGDPAQSHVRTALDIPDGTFVVGGCGTVDWRKGPDVFLLVAKAVLSRQPRRPVRFLWVGGERGALEMVRYDIDRLGLGASVDFVGERPDPAAYFSLFDAFLLTSREDPFPLVCLEAAALGVPTVCFADAGGMPEFVEDDAGCVVPYLDIDATADRLLSLMDAECTRAALGRRAATKVAERCSIDVIGPQIAAVLDECLR